MTTRVKMLKVPDISHVIDFQQSLLRYIAASVGVSYEQLSLDHNQRLTTQLESRNS